MAEETATTEQTADQITGDAKKQADAIIAQTDIVVQKMIDDAKAEADKLTEDAFASANKTVADAIETAKTLKQPKAALDPGFVAVAMEKLAELEAIFFKHGK